MYQPEKIIIADDHPLFRQALLATLTPVFAQCQWIEAQTAQELEQSLVEHHDADLVLLDLNIPGAHGFNNLVHIRQQYPHLPVAIVSAYEDAETISKAVELGAAGYIPKSTPIEKILVAINEILSGQMALPESYQPPTNPVSATDIAERVASLTQQQYKILMMFAEGMLNKQIAYDLNVSEATIKAHATAIFRKLDVRNRTQAVIAISQLEVPESGFNGSA